MSLSTHINLRGHINYLVRQTAVYTFLHTYRRSNNLCLYILKLLPEPDIQNSSALHRISFPARLPKSGISTRSARWTPVNPRSYMLEPLLEFCYFIRPFNLQACATLAFLNALKDPLPSCQPITSLAVNSTEP